MTTINIYVKLPGMNIDTYTLLERDSLADAIKRLEDRGFFLHRLGFHSKAPRTHHRTREANRRASALLPHRVETKRAWERRKQATFKGRWRHMRRSQREGFMSFEDWEALWKRAGSIELGDGTSRPAWQMRARGTPGWDLAPQRVGLRRWDTSGPYSLENVYVVYKDRTLADGAEIVADLREIAEWEINREEK